MARKRGYSRRDAIAMSACCDRSEITPYQYGRHTVSGVTVYDFGGGYAVAIKPGGKVPAKIEDSFGPWTFRGHVAGWDVLTAGEV